MIFKLFWIIFLFPYLLLPFKRNSDILNEVAVSEYDLKAVFIYHFIKYFEWPEIEKKEFFEISVFGKSDIIYPLKEIAKKKLGIGKKIQVKRNDDLSGIESSQILFVPKDSRIYIPDILKKTENLNILIIGEEEGLCEKGIAINFVIRDGNLKFEINEAVLKKKGIQPSSQILKLAVTRFGEKE